MDKVQPVSVKLGTGIAKDTNEPYFGLEFPDVMEKDETFVFRPKQALDLGLDVFVMGVKSMYEGVMFDFMVNEIGMDREQVIRFVDDLSKRFNDVYEKDG